MRQFLGFSRPDGRAGVRNHVLVVPTVQCAAVVCERITAVAPDIVVALPHTGGCGQIGPDMQVTHETLAAYCDHPNVGAVLVVALGCEQVVAETLLDAARRAGKPAESLAIQEEGGTPRTIARGREIASRMAESLARAPRQVCDASMLTLALKCGGSDFTSGLASNPALGRAADRLVDLGGRAVLGEVAEILGAEHLLGRRASRPDVRGRLLRLVERVEHEAMTFGLDIRGTQPAPGNIRGGLTTIEEKSLGAVHKGGERAPVVDIVPYAGRITQPGLTVMDTPGLDVESVTGMVGGGAQIVVFTTGLGTPTGNPVAPVLKITANEKTARGMQDNLDLDFSGVMTGAETLDAAADRLLDAIFAAASGQPVAAERHGHREFAIARRNVTI
jgi:altronate dehydratase large subunit